MEAEPGPDESGFAHETMIDQYETFSCSLQCQPILCLIYYIVLMGNSL